MPDRTLYHVHLFAVVRFKLENIVTASLQDAVHSARCHPLTGRWLRRLEDPQGVGEFAEEFSHYLVDVADDPEFEQSLWFHAEETPLLQLLRSLVRWDESGRPAEAINDIVSEARQILSRTA